MNTHSGTQTVIDNVNVLLHSGLCLSLYVARLGYVHEVIMNAVEDVKCNILTHGM